MSTQTSAELAEQIINWQTGKGGAYNALSLSDLIQQHHDAVVSECARAGMLLYARDWDWSGENGRLAQAIFDAIMALKGCA